MLFIACTDRFYLLSGVAKFGVRIRIEQAINRIFFQIQVGYRAEQGVGEVRPFDDQRMGISKTEPYDSKHSLMFSETGQFTDFFRDRKSTRLKSSHVAISYAVFCL